MLGVNKKKLLSLKPEVSRALIGYMKPYWMMLSGVLLSLIIIPICVITISIVIKSFIDNGLVAADHHRLNEALVMLLITVGILAIFTFCRSFLTTLTAERVIADIRVKIFTHILTLRPSFFEQNRTGDLISRLTSDTGLLLTLINSSLSMTVRNLITLICGLVMLFHTSHKLAAILLLIIPVVMVPLFVLGRRLRQYTKAGQDRVAHLTSTAEEVVAALKTVQSYGREDFENKRFKSLVHEQLRFIVIRVIMRSLLAASIIFLSFAGIGVVLWLGGTHVLEGNMSPGELSAFVYIAIVCAGSIAALSEVLGDWPKALGATERILEFLESKTTHTKGSGTLDIPKKIKGHIEFKDVSFSYNSNKRRKVLSSFTFEAQAGKVTAIVGKSGAGKTTLFMLLERFYDIDNGDIRIDGTSIYKFHTHALRSMFAYVSQDPFIFSTTVYQNILYGNPTATKEEVLHAAKEAGCMEFIDKMSNGMDTYLGDKGIKLSGGQKQRISIARAILSDPKILLLDEATSSLDSENEALIHNALLALMKGRTTIIIAHRLTTVKNADTIVFVEGGKVTESGPHDKLVRNPESSYNKLMKIQVSEVEV